MRKQAGSRNRGWLPAIRRRLESYGGHVGNRLSVAAGVALAAGLLAALAPRAEAVSATGGNYTNDIPGYRVHVFTNSATASNFVVSAASSGDTIDVLVVAGGGGGGGYIGGGGGGGGVLYSNSLSVSAVQYSIGVGIGGVGGTSISSAGGTAVGTRGGSSYFSNTVSGASITATGGGYGGGYDDQPGYTAPSIGGSGGGGCHGDSGLAKNGAAGISGQGYAGGNGTWASAYNAGGGGGAGTSGWSGTSTTGGTGGVGRVVDVTGTSVYYGGGGGGGGNAGNSAGPGGLGGGGAGSVTANGQDGTNSFGGGGGGGGQTFKNGGAGGSGIVIVRYSTAPTITVVPSGTLDFGQPLVNTTNTLTNTVSGANLANDITVTVTPYPEYQISTNNVDFTNTYTLVHTGGAVPTTTNYVRFSSAVVGLHPGAITNISGSVTQAVTLAADVALAAAPTLYRSPIQLPFGNVITNKSSTNNYTLWGSNLTANVSVTAPSSFFKLSTDNATFTSDPLNLTTNADGSLSSTTIYVQFTPTNGQAYDGSITNSSAGAENKMVSLAGTGVVQTLYVSAGSLNFGNVIKDTTSNLTYTVSGSNLEADVTLTVSGGTGFTIRTNGGSFGTSVTLTVPNKTQLAGGTLAAQTIVVQFAPTAVQTYSSVTITASSVGAANQTTALSGTGVNPPATVSITAPTANQMFNLGDAVSLTATAVPGTPSYWVAIYTNRASGTYGLATSQSGAGPAFTVSLGSSLAAGTYHVYATVTDSVNSVTYTSAVSAFIVQPAVQSPMLASGGDVIWTYTNYAGTASQTVYGVHQYTNADVAAFVPNAGLTNVDYLVVGGGGGGGAEGGGGGGGGLVKTGTVAVSAQAYSVVVGAGGLAGANGSTSIFHTVSALGGGAGALPGASYGNGGGGGGCWGANDAARAGGTGTGGGNSGGNGNGPDLGFPGAGGGGGGSAVGANGQNAPFNGQGGYGGAGIASAITGISTNYGGGGGGGVRANNTPTGGGAGGAGGGGAGGCSTSPYNGTAGSVNTGGGGGGAGGDQMGHSGSGANGGSGVVIVRYVIPPPPRGTVIMMR